MANFDNLKPKAKTIQVNDKRISLRLVNEESPTGLMRVTWSPRQWDISITVTPLGYSPIKFPRVGSLSWTPTDQYPQACRMTLAAEEGYWKWFNTYAMKFKYINYDTAWQRLIVYIAASIKSGGQVEFNKDGKYA